jgi:GxxExxY protein
VSKDIEALATIAVDVGFHLHRELGPGLLESVYELVLAQELTRKGLHVERQKSVIVTYRDTVIDNGFRIDLIVEDKLLIELKSVEKLAPIHGKQLLTYLRLMHLPLGLLMNFGAATFKEGIQRILNHYDASAAKHLSVNR